MKQRWILFLVCVGLVLGTSTGVCAFKYVQVGMDAPEGVMMSLDGKQINLQDVTGVRGTVVLFWALWSSRSLDQLADLAKAYDSLQAHDIAVVAISVDKQQFDGALIASIRAYVEEHEIPFPVLIDPGLKLFYAYGVVASPSSAVIDAQNRVVYDLAGYSPYAADTMILTTLASLGVEGVEGVEPIPLPAGDAMRKFRLGRRLYNKYQNEAALAYFTQSIEADSSFAAAHYYRGLTARRLQQPDTEVAAFRQAAALDQHNPVYRVAWAENRLAQADTAEAVRLLEEAVAVDTSYVEGYALLGSICLEREDLAGCGDFVDRGLAVDAENPHLLMVESARLARNGDTTIAVSVLREALQRLIGSP